jgi:uncharacterized protein (DUF305 family)
MTMRDNSRMASTTRAFTGAIVISFGLVATGCDDKRKSLEGEPTPEDRARFSSRHVVPPTPPPARVVPPSTGDPDHDFLRRIGDHHKDLIRIAHAAIESNQDASLAPAIRKFEDDHDHDLDTMQTLLQSVYNDAYVPLANPENDFTVERLRNPRTDNARAFLAAAEKSEQDAIRILNEYLPNAKRQRVRNFALTLKRDEANGMAALRNALGSRSKLSPSRSTR